TSGPFCDDISRFSSNLPEAVWVEASCGSGVSTEVTNGGAADVSSARLVLTSYTTTSAESRDGRVTSCNPICAWQHLEALPLTSAYSCKKTAQESGNGLRPTPGSLPAAA